MIGVDTNILIRLLVDDDKSQSERAARFFSLRTEADPAFITNVVLVEMIWTLRRQYGYPASRIVDAIEALTQRADIRVEQHDIVIQAVALSRGGGDFGDALVSLIAQAAGCHQTVTFDQKAARRIPAMELLA